MTGESPYSGAVGSGKRLQEPERSVLPDREMGTQRFGPCRRLCSGFVGVVSGDDYSVAPCPCHRMFPRIAWICPVPLPQERAVGSKMKKTDGSLIGACAHPDLLRGAMEMKLAWIPVVGDSGGSVRSGLYARSAAASIHPRALGLRQALESFLSFFPGLRQRSLEELYPGCVVESSADQRTAVLEQQEIKRGAALRASSEHFVVLGSEVGAVVRHGFQARRVIPKVTPLGEKTLAAGPKRAVSLHEVEPDEIEASLSGRCVLLVLTSADLMNLWRSDLRREQLRAFVERVDSSASSLVLFSPSPPYDVQASRREAPVMNGEQGADQAGRESFLDSRRKLRFRSTRMAKQDPAGLRLEKILDGETFATLILLLHRAYLDVLLPSALCGQVLLKEKGEKP